MRGFRNQFVMVFVATAAVALSLIGFGYFGQSAQAAGEANDEIHSSFGDTSSQMKVYWHGPDSTFQYGLDVDYGQSSTAELSSITPVDTSGNFWQLTLSGLTADSTYHYKIGSTGIDHTFKTPSTGDYTWVDIGDTGSSFFDSSSPSNCNKTWMPNVWQQVASEQPSFVTHGGDISYANECGQPAVHTYWNDIAPVSTQVAMEYAWGNHEYGSTVPTSPSGTPRDSMANYKGRFTMSNPQIVPNDSASQINNPGCPSPQNPKQNGCMGDDWGYFQVGHTLYISYPEPWAKAYSDWLTKADSLMATAESDANIYFIVTYGHRPAYSSQASNSINSDLQAAVNALGDKYSPTARSDGKYVLNIGHHVHGGEVFSPKHGVVNVTNGGGGSEESNILNPSSGSMWVTNHLEHMLATVTGNRMKLDFICGPVFTLNPTRDPCTQGNILYTQNLTGYQSGPAMPSIVSMVNDGVTSARLGDTVTYTSSVQNPVAGSTAVGVNMTMTVPSNLTITNAGSGTVSGNTITWSLGDIVGGQNVSETVVTQLTSGTVGDTFSDNISVTTGDNACGTGGSTCLASDVDTIASSLTQFITNQSVEVNSTEWAGTYNSYSKLSRVKNDGYDGVFSMQVLRNNMVAGQIGIIAKPAPVTSTIAGGSYQGSLWVRSQTAGSTISLFLKETTPTGKLVASSTISITTADTLWHQINNTYVAHNNGDILAYTVLGNNIAANSWFHMDSMSLLGP